VYRVLITGGAGFIGGFLAQAFVEQGHAVDLVDNLVRGRKDRFLADLLQRDRVRLFTRDLLEADALADLGVAYTHLFHLAAIVGVEHVLSRPYETLQHNVQLLETALEFARRLPNLERFVFASTSEVYAGSLEHLQMPLPTPEDTPIALPSLIHPRTSYMLSKIYGEAMVRHAAVPFTIVRPHNVYGPRMGLSHVIPQLLERAHRAVEGSDFEVFSVDHRRTFCFVDDAVEMIVRAATVAGGAGQVFNLGSQGPEISIRELAEVIVRIVGKRLTIEAKPATPGSPRRRCPDMSRMTELTGYSARIPLAEGVRRTYEWYRRMVFEGGEQVAT
jgi:nucleoside-diphosphate-sugar epimerase